MNTLNVEKRRWLSAVGDGQLIVARTGYIVRGRHKQNIEMKNGASYTERNVQCRYMLISMSALDEGNVM